MLVLMIGVMATDEHDVTHDPATTDGPGADVPGGQAAPGDDLSTPIADHAGPVTTVPDPHDGRAAADAHALAADTEPARAGEVADVEWQMPFWGRPAGHVEALELTPLIRGAIEGGKLTVVVCEAAAPCTPHVAAAASSGRRRRAREE